jgi:hypothetical protein
VCRANVAAPAGSSGALHDLQLPGSGAPDYERHLASGIAAIGENAFDEREQPPRPAQQAQGAVTILNIGRMHDDIHCDFPVLNLRTV